MKLVAIDFETATVELQCSDCYGSGYCQTPDADWCEDCGGTGSVSVYLGTLIANLAVAGALCWSHRLGLNAMIPAHRAALRSWGPNTRGEYAPTWSKP